MKALLKIFFESQQEMEDYQRRMLDVPNPVAVALAEEKIQRAQRMTPKPKKVEQVPAPEPEEQAEEKPVITCAYPGCGQPFVPETSEDKYCRMGCQQKHRKLIGYVKDSPARKRGRPKITRNIES